MKNAKKTSHYRSQCAKWFSRYSISKSGNWARWTSPFCWFSASFSVKYDVTDAILQDNEKMKVQYLRSLLFETLQACRNASQVVKLKVHHGITYLPTRHESHKINLSRDQIVALPDVSICRATSFECLRHIYLSLRRSTTYPSMVSKSWSLLYFELILFKTRTDTAPYIHSENIMLFGILLHFKFCCCDNQNQNYLLSIIEKTKGLLFKQK